MLLKNTGRHCGLRGVQRSGYGLNCMDSYLWGVAYKEQNKTKQQNV